MTPRHCQSLPQSLGIDVAKAAVVIAERDGQGRIRHRTRRNTPAVLARSMTAWAEAGFKGPVVIEATGHWHWPALFAARDAGLDVRLVNPVQAAKHRRGEVRRCKTDRHDARRLAEMVVTEAQLPGPCRLTRADVRLRQRLNLQQQLERLIQSQQATLTAHREAARLAGVAPAGVLEALEAQLAELRTQRQALQAEIEAAARQQAAARTVATWTQLPGISRNLATVLAGLLDPAAPSANSWVAFVGLDISGHQSGTRRGRTRLTKRGQAFLRKRLFQAAWGAMIHNPAVRAYYQALRATGRAYVEALTIIARKLLRAAYALMHHPERTVDANRLFALPT